MRLPALLLAVGTATLLVPLPWRIAADLSAREVTSGRDLDSVLTALTLGGASIAVWPLLGWVLVIGVLTLVANAPGALGRVARSALARITPGFLRRSIAIGMSVGALTGVATSTAPAVAGTAVAGTAVATVSIGGSAPAPGLLVPAGQLTSSITRVASAVATGADRVGDHAITASAARVCLLLSADGQQDGVSWPTGETATSRTAGSAPAAPGTAARGTAASGTAARGVPSPASAGEINLDWPVHRPSMTSRAPVDLDWPMPTTIVVHRGDTLWSIAARQLGPDATDAQIDSAWHRWYGANRGVIGDDPDVILPGQELHAPPAQTP